MHHTSICGDVSHSKRSKAQKPVRSFETCPNCGESFPAGRLACPECGSDAETGWKDQEEIDYESVELPEPEEDRKPRADKTLGFSRAVLAVGVFVVVLALILGLARWL